MECPFCGESVTASDLQCRSCGERLSEHDEPASSESSKTVLIVLGVLFGVFALFCLVMAGAGFVTYRSASVAMQTEIARMDAEGLADGAVRYQKDIGSYPAALQDISQDPGLKGWSGPYWVTSNQGLDPWGNPWIYAQTATGFTITSYGADGVPGGSDLDADIVVTR